MRLPYPFEITYTVTCDECGKTETYSSPVHAEAGFPIPGFPGWSAVLDDNGSRIYCPEHKLFMRCEKSFDVLEFKPIT